MPDLRLGLIIDASGNHNAVFGGLIKTSHEAAESIAGHWERVSSITESIGRSAASLGLSLGSALEVRDVLETAEAYERTGAQMGLTEQQMKKLTNSIFDNAQATHVADGDLREFWEGWRHAGGDVDSFAANIGTASTQLQIAGGDARQLGEAMASLKFWFEIDSPAKLAQGMATLRQQLVGTKYTIGDISGALGGMAASYSATGHRGTQAMKDLGATVAVIAQGTRRPQQAIGFVNDILGKLSSPQGMLAFENATGIDVVPDWSKTDPSSGLPVTATLPSILGQLVEKSKLPGWEFYLEQALGPGGFEALRGLRAKPDLLKQFMSINGDPTADAKTAKELGDNIGGAANSVAAAVKKEGVALNGVLKPIWGFVNAHSTLLGVLGSLMGALVALNTIFSLSAFGWKAIGTTALIIRGPLVWLITNLAYLASGVFPLLADAIFGFGVAIGGAPVWAFVAGVAALAASAYVLYRAWKPIEQLFIDLSDLIPRLWDKIRHPFSSKESWSGLSQDAGNAMENFQQRFLYPKGTDNQRTAFGMLRGFGWSSAQAAGLVSNLYRESNLNPSAVGDHGAAIGIAQWHADRQKAIETAFGKRIGEMSLEEQLRAVDWELRQGGERMAGDSLSRAKDPEQAGRLVSRLYERPEDQEGEASLRGAMAADFVRRLAAATPDKPKGEPNAAAFAPQGPGKEQTAFGILRGLGWSSAQAVGLISNLYRESGLDPSAVGGIAQWNAGRQDAIEKAFGKPVGKMSLAEQLRAVDWELREGGERKTGDDLSRVKDPDEAGQLVSRRYEGHPDNEGEAGLRGSMALDLVRRLAAMPPQKVQVDLNFSGLPQGSKADVKNASPNVDLRLGKHMSTAQ